MDIPDYLQKLVDETDVEQYAREQAALRAKHGIDAARRNENRGQQWIDYCERQILLSLPWLKQLIEDGAPAEVIDKESDRVAVCYMYLGQFTSALFWATSDQTKTRIKNLELAVDRMGTPSVHQHEKNGALAVAP